MMFEYKVVPAPTRGLKAKGIKSTQDRFANALQSLMNEHGAQGWEYQRTDTLPVEERQGLTGKTTSYQNMLVFRRTLTPHLDTQPKVAALIEDQSSAVDAENDPVKDNATSPNVNDATKVATPVAETDIDLAPIADQNDDASSDEAKARVDETLKAEPFTFPWNNRAKTADADPQDDEDTPRPAE